MKRIFGAVLALGAIAGAHHSASASDLSLYGRLPSIEDMELSPDGKALAMILTDGENRRVYVRDIAAQKTLVGLDAGPNRVSYIKWANRDNLMLEMLRRSIDEPTISHPTAVMVNIRTGKQAPLLGNQSDKSLDITFGAPTVRSEGGGTVLYVTAISFDDGRAAPSVFRITATGQIHLAARGATDTAGFLIDDRGEVVAEATLDSEDHYLSRGVTRLKMLQSVVAFLKKNNPPN